MGCVQSAAKPQEPPAEAAIRTALIAYEKHLAEFCRESKEPMLKAYLSTCVEVLKMQFHEKASRSVSIVREIAEKLGEPFASAGRGIDEDYCADDGMLKELVAWLRNPPKNDVLSEECRLAILRELFLPESEKGQLNTYSDLLRINFQCSQHPELHEIFTSLAEGQQTLSVDAFSRFLKTQGYEREVSGNAKLKIRSCFGGEITKYSFSSYYSGPQTNSVLDPQRATIVFQDMTQPLCSYSIRTAAAESQTALSHGLALGARAFIFSVRRHDTTDEMLVGKDSLTDCLQTLKDGAFDKSNEYPVLLIFPTVELAHQESLAKVITSVLGAQLAKGVMFDGSSLHSPQFTPAALARKFLVVAPQAPLKPFVGLHVADMRCDGLGVKVTSVEDGTPAAKANINKDDWLTHIDGTPIANREQLKQCLSQLHLGREITFRKETQEMATVIVGGTFANCDPRMRELSNITYLGIPEKPKSTYAHWECEMQKYPYQPSHHHTHLQHFVLLSEEATDSRKVVAADDAAVQLLNASSRQGSVWADAKFAENARCGYVLHRNPASSVSQLRFTAVSSLRKRTAATIVSLSADVLGGESFTGQRSILITVESDFRIIQMNVTARDAKGEFVYTTSVSAHMLRRGYHAISLFETPYEGAVDLRTADSMVFLLEREENSGV